MKSLKFLEKIGLLAGRKKKNTSPGSVFSQNMSQQPHYKARSLKEETGKRKKSLRERWQDQKKHRQQQNVIESGRSKNEKRIRRPLQVVLLLSLLLFTGNLLLKGPLGSAFANWNYFSLHDIEISGCRVTSPKGLREYAEISYQLNMLTLDPGAIEKRLLSHPWVAAAEIRRIWPDGLAVSIREYHPQALIVGGDKEPLWYMDSAGVVFAPVASGQEIDFPVITGLDAFHSSEEKEQMIASATSFLRLAKRNNPNLPAQNVSEIHFTDNGELVLFLVKHPFPIYFGREGIKRKYYQLRKVLEVLYRKEKGGALIEKVAYILMSYQNNKVLVVQKNAG